MDKLYIYRENSFVHNYFISNEQQLKPFGSNSEQ